MKRFLIILLAALIALPAFADMDLSGLTFEELARLRDRCQMEMMARDEWQEVIVPIGLYKIGEDIPEGHWTITVSDKTLFGSASIRYGDLLNASMTDVASSSANFFYRQIYKENGRYYGTSSMDINLLEGNYLSVSDGAVIFTPYTGKPDLGFK